MLPAPCLVQNAAFEILSEPRLRHPVSLSGEFYVGELLERLETGRGVALSASDNDGLSGLRVRVSFSDLSARAALDLLASGLGARWNRLEGSPARWHLASTGRPSPGADARVQRLTPPGGLPIPWSIRRLLEAARECKEGLSLTALARLLKYVDPDALARSEDGFLGALLPWRRFLMRLAATSGLEKDLRQRGVALGAMTEELAPLFTLQPLPTEVSLEEANLHLCADRALVVEGDAPPRYVPVLCLEVRHGGTVVWLLSLPLTP